MKNFEEQIRRIIKEDINLSSKTEMKSRLMQSISEDSLLTKLKNALSNVSLTRSSKAIMKEKLMAVVGGQTSWWSDFCLFLTGKRWLTRSVASVSAFALLVMVTLQPFTQINSVSAHFGPRIDKYEGDVYVVRDGLEFKVNKNIELKRGDVIETDGDGFASIVFPDDSVIRLSNDTEVKLTHVNGDALNTELEVEIVEGKVWNNMVGLDGDDSYYTFKIDNIAGLVTDRSTFDIEVANSYTRIVTVDKSVSLSVETATEVVPVVLTEGEVVKVKKETSYLSYLDTIKFQESLSEVDLNWAKTNIEEDEIYEENLAQEIAKERKKQAGITPGNIFYPVEELQRKTKIAVTADPVKKEQVKLDIANNKLLEAEVMINKGKKDEVADLLNDYETTVTEVKEKVVELQSESFEEAEKLNEGLKAAVQSHKKALDEVLPDSEVFEVKEVVRNAELSLAVTEAEKKRAEIKKAEEILDDVEKLVERDQKDLASEKINEYVETIDKVVEEIDVVPEEEKVEVIDDLIDAKVKGIVSLDAVQKKADSKGSVLPELTEARQKAQADLDAVVQKATVTGDVELQKKAVEVEDAPIIKESLKRTTDGQIIIDEVDLKTFKESAPEQEDAELQLEEEDSALKESDDTSNVKNQS